MNLTRSFFLMYNKNILSRETYTSLELMSRMPPELMRSHHPSTVPCPHWAPRSHVFVPRYCLQHNVRDWWQVEKMWINSCRQCTQPPPPHKKTRVEPTTTYYHALMMGIRNREGPLLDCFAWWAPRSHVLVPRYCLQHNVRDRWQVEKMWINSCRQCTQPPPPTRRHE